MNEIRIVIRGDNRADSAMRDATRGADRLEDSLNDAADAAARVGQEAEESGNSIGSALGDSAGGILENLGGRAGMVGEILGRLGPAGIAAGAAIGAAVAGAAAAFGMLTRAIDASVQRAADLGRMKAQLLLSPEDAAKYGRIAGEVYADNWGESLEEASNYVRDAALYIMPTPAVMDAAIAPSLKVVSEKVAALAGTMEEDSKKVAVAIKQMLVTGMAKSAEEAFDLLHAGIAKGVNSADDLLDTFIEYSTQFRQLGLDGQTAMGLMSQGLQNGARDADTVADGLKEIAIRAQDGSKLSADAFKSLGLDADQLGADFAAGGDRAKAALDKVLDAFRNIKDPATQAQLAVALFGTKAEDMQEALFNLDVDSAASALGDIAGAADLAASHLSGNAYSAIESYRRRWELFKADLGDKFLPVFERVMKHIERFATEAGPVITEFLDMMRKKWDENHEAIEQAGQLLGIVFGAGAQATLGVFMMAVNGVVETVIAIGNAWESIKQKVAAAVMFILQIIGRIVHGAAIAFGWIPGIGPKLNAAAIQFDKFASDVNKSLADIQDVNVNVNFRYNRIGEAPPGFKQGTTSSGWRIAASGGTASGLTMVHRDELIDLGASARVYNPQESRRMLAAGNAAPAAPVLAMGAAGNSLGVASGAMHDLLRYLLNGPIRAYAEPTTGRVRVA